MFFALRKRLVVTLRGLGAGQAQALAVAFDEAVEVDAFAATGAGEACALVAGKFAGRQRDAHPLLAEKIVVGKLAIGVHLLRIFFELRIKFLRARLRAFKRNNAKALVGVVAERRAEVDERRRHLAPVAQLQRALADPAPGDDADGVGSTAVDFDNGDEAFAVGAGPAARVFDAQAAQRKHRHAHAEDLPRAQMSVSNFGFAQ